MPKRNGKWWKYSEYQISDGRICPKPKAKLSEYNPWSSHIEPSRRSRELELPYSSLLKLALQLKNDPPRGELRGGRTVAFELSPPSESAVLNWCNQFGLIGIYPLRLALAMTLQSTVALMPTSAEKYSADSDCGVDALIRIPGPLGPMLVAYQCVCEDTLGPGSGKTEAMIANALRGGLVESVRSDNEHIRRDWISAAAAATHPIEDHDCCSPAYWFGYSEPVDSFVAHAWRFLDAAEGLTGVTDGALRAPPTWRASAEYLSALANIAFRYATNTAANGFSETEWAPSLFSSFARMLLDDYDDGKRFLLRCETCSTIIVSEDSRAKYCSLKCRQAMMMRKYRDRKERNDSSEVRHEN